MRLFPHQLPAEDPAGLHAPHRVGISQLQELLAQLPGDNDLAKDIHTCICGEEGSTVRNAAEVVPQGGI